MRLKQVTGIAFSVVCIRCQKRGTAGSERYRSYSRTQENPEVRFADLDGIPFKSYYCESCAVKGIPVCTRCGHTSDEHENRTGPCNWKISTKHCVCYQFQRKDIGQ